MIKQRMVNLLTIWPALFLCLWSLCCLPVCDANALGLGLTVGKTSNDSFSYEYHRHDNLNDDVEYTSEGNIIGLVLDTNVSEKSIYNYRMEIQRTRYTLTDPDGTESDLEKWTFDHSFGFRVYQNNWMRIWLGPQLRHGHAWGDQSLDQYCIGLAPVLGINFNLGRYVSPSVTLGYRKEAFMGSYKETIDTNGDTHRERVDFVGMSEEMFLQATILFRVN